MFDKINHYSITTPASVYDEEAMTAIELAGRTTKKFNELVDDTKATLDTIPEVVAKDVNNHITKGDFDKQIDRHTSALTREIDGLFTEVNELDHRVDNLVVNGSENSPEVVDLRLGADGHTYPTAGGATRSQLKQKVDKTEYYPVEYETGTVGIGSDGWDYNDTYNANVRVRIKEGKELHLYAGDVIGLRDYSDARFYIGIRIDNKYTFVAWQTSDYTVTTEGDYIILIAHASDTGSNTPEDPDILGGLLFVKKNDGTVRRAEHAHENIANALDVDLNINLGVVSSSNPDPENAVYMAVNRYVSRYITTLPFDIVLKHNAKIRMAVHTYTNTNGVWKFGEDKGWVTDKGDYVVKAGTHFRIMVMSDSYDTEATLVIPMSEQYDNDMYNSIVIEPVNGRGINLMKSARTLIRLATQDSVVKKTTASPRKVHGVAHRGAWSNAYGDEYPENSLMSVKRAKANGYDFVECDVRFSSDNVPYLLHDADLNRVTNGRITSQIHTLESSYLDTVDISDTKGKYSEKLVRFEAFIKLCSQLNVHPYIEVQNNGGADITSEQAGILVNIVKRYGLANNATWISFNNVLLLKIVGVDPFARIGYNIANNFTDMPTLRTRLTGMQTGVNEVFTNSDSTNPSIDNIIKTSMSLCCGVEVWTVNTVEEMVAFSEKGYISGYTTDRVNASTAIAEYIIGG